MKNIQLVGTPMEKSGRVGRIPFNYYEFLDDMYVAVGNDNNANLRSRVHR